MSDRHDVELGLLGAQIVAAQNLEPEDVDKDDGAYNGALNGDQNALNRVLNLQSGARDSAQNGSQMETHDATPSRSAVHEKGADERASHDTQSETLHAAMHSLEAHERASQNIPEEWFAKKELLTLQTCFCQATRSCSLDLRRHKMKDALGSTSAASVLFSSKPLRAAISYPVVKLYIFLLGFFNLLGSIDRMGRFLVDGRLEYQHFKLRVDPAQLRVDSIGLLWHGKPMLLHDQNLTHDANGALLSFPNLVEANGFYFSTKAEHASEELVRRAQKEHLKYEMWASNDLETWDPVYPPVLAERWPGLVSTASDFGGISLPGREGDLVWSRELQAPWPWIIERLFRQMGNSVLFSATLAFAVTGRNQGAVYLYSSVMVWAASMSWIVAVQVTEPATKIYYICGGLTTAPIFTSVLFGEKRIVLAVFLAGFLDCIVETVKGYWFDLQMSVGQTVIRMSPSFWAMGFAIWVFLYRRKLILESVRLVEPDFKLYEHIWQTMLRDSEVFRAVESLEQLVTSMGLSNEKPRQIRNCAKAEIQISAKFWWQSCLSSLSGEWYADLNEADRTHLVESLDELYVQAMFMQIVLVVKTKRYAIQCNGMFPLLDDQSPGNEDRRRKKVAMVRYKDVHFIKDFWKKIRWPQVKKQERTLEKCVRTYGNDVSCLVDLARHSIVFETVQDLIGCLKSIQEDKEIIIVRIKNRFSCSYDSRASYGYRDVALNLRICNNVTCYYGLQNHIVELQLLLREFAEVKSDAGHSRYVTCRNLRAE